MKSIFVYQHLGLGDHIICNGLIRSILERDNPKMLYLPVKECNLPSIISMYKDEDRIVLLPIDSKANNTEYRSCYLFEDSANANKVYNIGFNNRRDDWDVSFYDCAGIPFEKRWTGFKLNRNTDEEKELERKVNPSKEPFILVHDIYSVSTATLKINTQFKVIKVTNISNNIFNWCGLIEQAQEVHCIDSSFIHLCQSIRNNGYFHNFKRVDRKGSKDYFTILPTWKTIGY